LAAGRSGLASGLLRCAAMLRALAISLMLFGCTDAENADDDATVVDGKADGVTEFKLSITSTLRAKETPKLPGAPSGSTSFACNETRTDDGWRLACTRNKEELTLMYGPDEKLGAIVYKKTTSSPDRRAYYHCAATTAAADKWPSELQCTAKQPKTIIDGQLVSPFASSVDGVGIFNAHEVSDHLFRGMKPFRDADFEDLKNLGVDAVLIFKKPTAASEVQEETDALDPIGVPASRVENVQFPWKDFGDFAEPCKMTVRSLKLLKTWTAAGKTAFFHCTVGEDRTGYLAGLYRLMTETATTRAIFDAELCEHGYSAGNPQKPYLAVAKEVDDDLTPLFLKMAFKISKGELANFDESICDEDPANDPEFVGSQWTATNYRCASSTRYRL
jgi:hypothetical protein